VPLASPSLPATGSPSGRGGFGPGTAHASASRSRGTPRPDALAPPPSSSRPPDPGACPLRPIQLRRKKNPAPYRAWAALPVGLSSSPSCFLCWQRVCSSLRFSFHLYRHRNPPSLKEAGEALKITPRSRERHMAKARRAAGEGGKLENYHAASRFPQREETGRAAGCFFHSRATPPTWLKSCFHYRLLSPPRVTAQTLLKIMG